MRKELEDPAYEYYPHKRPMTPEQLDEIEFILTNNALRDVYDKHQIVVSEEEFNS